MQVKVSSLTPADLDYLRPLFWAKVDRRGPDECWPWLGVRQKWGYGELSFGHRGKIRANRLAVVLAGRALSDQEHACHHCDNPPCCNAAHLFVGLPADNARDRDQKGRRRTRPICGEESRLSKLTAVQVLEIRRRRAEGASLGVLALEYGVTKSAIGEISRGESWSHLGPFTPILGRRT